MLIKEKIEQAKKILREFDVECWITFVRESQINGDPSLAFLAPADVTWHSAFIITNTGKATAIVGRYDRPTIEDTCAYDEVISFVESIKDPFQKVIKDINPGQIALNYSEGSEIADGLTHGMFLTMRKLLDDSGMSGRIISSERLVSALRERKSETEIQRIKAAIKQTEEIFRAVSRFIKPGKTEKEVAAFMKNEVAERKLDFAWEPAVCPAVFTGPDTAEAHYAPSDKKIERGHVLNIDFGVKVEDYCSDMQRTFYITEKPDAEIPADVQMGFDTIIESIEKSKEAMKPGIVAKDIDAIARQIVVKNGYEEFPHGLGHQVGRFSHDGTALLGPAWEKYAQKPYQKLEEGMVFTIEPRLNVKDRGIVTVEEMVIVTKTGADWLSNPQKELILIH